MKKVLLLGNGTFAPLHSMKHRLSHSGVKRRCQFHGRPVTAATPRPIVEKLWQDVRSVLLDPEIVERGKVEGNRALNLNPQQSDEYVRKDFPKWKALYETAQIFPT